MMALVLGQGGGVPASAFKHQPCSLDHASGPAALRVAASAPSCWRHSPAVYLAHKKMVFQAKVVSGFSSFCFLCSFVFLSAHGALFW